ncbi:chemotaxis protein, partial [Vibrio vulnificus]
MLVQHISASPESYIAAHFDSKSHLSVHEAEDKQPIKNGNMYIAPPNYHMMIETDGC